MLQVYYFFAVVETNKAEFEISPKITSNFLLSNHLT